MVDAEQEILNGMLLLSHAMRRVLQDEVLAPFKRDGINSVRVGILHLLERRREQSVNMLARLLGISKAAASQNVDRLVRLGLADRQPDDQDRRTVWVSITSRGRKLLSRVKERQMQKLRTFLEKIPDPLLDLVRGKFRELSLALLETSEGEHHESCLLCCAFGAAQCVRCPSEEGGEWVCSFVRNGAPAFSRKSGGLLDGL